MRRRLELPVEQIEFGLRAAAAVIEQHFESGIRIVTLSGGSRTSDRLAI